jgi:cytochrome c oxidase assembly protein subunit 15
MAVAGLARTVPEARTAAWLFAGAIAVQYGLGIVTLLLVVPVPLGTLHQTVAALVLAAGLLALHRLRGALAS